MYCVLLRALSRALPRLHLNRGATHMLLQALHFTEGDTQSQSAQGLNTGHWQHRSLSPFAGAAGILASQPHSLTQKEKIIHSIPSPSTRESDTVL